MKLGLVGSCLPNKFDMAETLFTLLTSFGGSLIYPVSQALLEFTMLNIKYPILAWKGVPLQHKVLAWYCNCERLSRFAVILL